MNEKLREEFNQWVLDGRSAQWVSLHLPFVKEAMQWMNMQPRDRILEIGCGEGWAARLLAPLVPEGSVVGLDVSDAMIRKARALSVAFENILFLWADAEEEIPWQEKFFTKALCVETFYYFENPEKALREIYRVLSPGGSVWILNHISKENEITLGWLQDAKVAVKVLSVEEYGTLLGGCGFEAFSCRMIPDRTPISQHPYYRALEDPAQFHRFQELGAMWMEARRPEE